MHRTLIHRWHFLRGRAHAVRKLGGADRRLLLGALRTEVGVRLLLWAVPSRVLLRHVARRVEGVGELPGISDDPRRVGRAVQLASRVVPGSTCLTRALTTQLILARMGRRSLLRIGVTRGEEGSFEAHAWVEAGGHVVVGRKEHARFVPLPDLGPVLR